MGRSTYPPLIGGFGVITQEQAVTICESVVEELEAGSGIVDDYVLNELCKLVDLMLKPVTLDAQR